MRWTVAVGIMSAAAAALALLFMAVFMAASWWVDPGYGGVKATIEYCATPQAHLGP